ncbi:TonB-dependent receptor [Mariniphaga sediminis]|uniref:TonB-dependent receptor n=1 Tax=Mariniphaga sediminis TaxID=1628158 RepID=A0A399CTW6_9BACT|nr:TonB-dependent receptor [Mariniphaga sediminis]RIH62987.1 TonB-dependent receptor [Mariniphaga sediminis]
MKFLFVYAILLLFTFTLTGQTVQVITTRTGKPLEGVLVIGENFTFQTDIEGKVSLDNIKPDEKILFQHSSFLKFSSTKERIADRGNIVMLIEDPVRLDEVVISVNRWEQTKNEIPHKIHQIGAEEVLQNQPQTTADMLGSKGGVFVQKSQMGGGSPMIRGFAANRVLLVVDGIRMNNAIYRSGNLHNVISLDANSLEKTEVIFGPGSVIYGSDALGGVMSFNTFSPRLSTSEKAEQKGKIMSRVSSANMEKMIHGRLNFGRKKWAALVSTTFSDFDNLRMGTHGPEEYLRPEYVQPGKMGTDDRIVRNRNPKVQVSTGYRQFNLMAKARYRPNEYFDVTLGAHLSQTSDIPRYDRLVVYRNDALRYARWYYGPQQWSLVSARIDYRRTHVLFDKLNILAGFQQYAESRHDRSLYAKEMFRREEALDIFSFNVDLGKTLNKRNDFFYGAEAFLNKVGSKGTAENISGGTPQKIAPRYPDGSDYKSWAGYFSWKYNLKDQLILQAGMRYTYTELNGQFDPAFYNFPFQGFDMKNSALNGNAGLVWHPTPDWQINLNASTGFRSPNIDDVAKVFDSEPGNVVVPNPDLRPEYTRNLEAGIVRSYAGKAKVELTVFFTHLKDAMVRRDFSLGGSDSIVYDGVLSKVEALVNAESARVFGGNFSFEYLFSPAFRTRNDISFARGEDADGYPLRHVPPVFGSSHFLFEKQRWFFDMYVDYSGKFDFEQLAPDEQEKPHLYAADENGKPWSPGWWTLNVKMNWRMSDVFSIAGGVENIFDRRYRTYSSGVVAPGINFFLSLGVHF